MNYSKLTVHNEGVAACHSIDEGPEPTSFSDEPALVVARVAQTFIDSAIHHPLPECIVLYRMFFYGPISRHLRNPFWHVREAAFWLETLFVPE
jgi:hypothetical protein